MFAVTIDLDAYDNLPPRQLKAMLRALRFADEGGVVRATLSMLAMPGMSRSTAHREMTAMTDIGHIARRQRPEGGFLWRIGRRFRSARKGAESASFSGCRIPSSWDASAAEPHGAMRFQGSVATLNGPPDGPRNGKESLGFLPEQDGNFRFGTPVPAAETPVPHAGTTDSRARARLELSSGSKEPSERELLSQQDEIPSGWEEAAAAERRLAGLGPVNLRREWRALVNYSEGQPITIWRWRGWALKARGDGTADAKCHGAVTPAELARAKCSHGNPLPGDESQQRHARDWVRSGFWLRNGAWGPAPDRPGCTLPAGLIAWCRRERAALVAAA